MTDLNIPDQVHLPGLLGGGWASCAFEPFRDGVDICWIRRSNPGVALLRYAPGASVPLHRHAGLETIFVLAGSQSDEQGHYPAGSVVLNPEGSIHSVRSEGGCIILIQWERPVEILEDLP